MGENMNPEDKDAPISAIKYQYSPKCRTFLNERAVLVCKFRMKFGPEFGKFFVSLRVEVKATAQICLIAALVGGNLV